MPASEDYTPLDTLKRYLSAPRRAVGEGLSALATLPQRAFQASEQMRTEGPYDPAPAVEAGLLTMGTGAIAGAPVRAGETALGAGPIRAYHSSPHDFERFDLSKVGTGEGAQVYGHGLYFAENPAVSGQGGQYWNQFQRRFEGPEALAAEHLKSAGFDRAKAIEKLRETGPKLGKETDDLYRQLFDTNPPVVGGGVGDYAKAVRLLESGQPVGPRTYEVNINADPAHMLDWDKPFHGQHAVVQDVLSRSGIEPGPLKTIGEATGRALRDPGSVINQNLDRAGIPAIRYLDEHSRRLPSASQFRIGQPNDYKTGIFDKADKGWYVTSGPGSFYRQYGPFETEAAADALRASEPWKTRNYVVRDASILDIVKKYGLAGLTAPPAIAGAMNQERQP